MSGFLQHAVMRLRRSTTAPPSPVPTPAPTPVKHWFAHSIYGGKERVYFGLYNYQEIRHSAVTDSPRIAASSKQPNAAPHDTVLRQYTPEVDGMSKRAAAAVINKLFLQRTRSVAFRVAPPSGTATSMKHVAEAALTTDKNLLDQMETRWDKQQMDAPLRAPAPVPALATQPVPAPTL